MPEQTPHIPVLAAEMLRALAPRDGGLYVDGAFGAGGYARAILEAADCAVIGIDRDPAAVALGAAVADRYPGRFRILRGRFGKLDSLMRAAGHAVADGVALDLGVSSMQLGEAGRGFSFAKSGPLDMRMAGTGDLSDAAAGATAADVVNGRSEAALADLIRRLGEERQARRIARAIVAARTEAPIETTDRLADIVRRAVGGGAGQRIDPATRTFQALRLFVNDELGELERGLSAAERALTEGGRLAIVAFHSLEDRIVKRFLRGRSGAAAGGSRHFPHQGNPTCGATFELIVRSVEKPTAQEIARNARARSARLRWAVRTDEPARTGT